MSRITRRTQAIDVMLDTLALGSIVAASIIAPNIIQVLAPSYVKHMKGRDKNREVKHLMQYMKRQAIIDIKEVDDEYIVSITEKGKKRIARVNFENLVIPTPKSWDGKWRIVIFDIPEHYASARRALTDKLYEIGFKLLQKSVWVHPFPCLEQIEVIKQVYPEVEPFVVLIESNEIDKHNQLVDRFKKII